MNLIALVDMVTLLTLIWATIGLTVKTRQFFLHDPVKLPLFVFLSLSILYCFFVSVKSVLWSKIVDRYVTSAGAIISML